MKEERKRILKMVEDGKLSVEEALTLLEKLEKAEDTAEQKQEEIIKELSTAVKFEEEKKEEPFNYKFNSAKDKIIDFVDSAFKKIKDVDLDFNFGQSHSISHIFHQSDGTFNEIEVDVANGAIKVVPWSQTDVRAECEVKVYRAESQDEARKKFLEDAVFTVVDDKLKFSTQQKWIKLDAVLYVPEKEYNKLKLRTFNGPIESEKLKAKTFKAKTANGKITAKQLQSKHAELETVHGKIHVENGTVDILEAETINGAVHVDGDYERVNAHSFNGNVACAVGGSRCESIEAKATTGNVEVTLPPFAEVSGELKTNLGSFDIHIEGIEILEEKSDVIQKVLRFRSIKDPQGGLRLNADTKTGSVTVKKSSSVF
ncbi:DUF4097 domain-containing protein [Cytobacillus kochii]|uniref:DUF4097 family beta strand repeat-containing protein n=1 Tax=Cytobacillus TaxID=2675230 RepID=UPI00277E26F5|nr:MULTISPECIES: DUF4097 domain-containing protein [Cytobacillus]MDQ0187800.1 DUF4097 and DUF4098 domain-containing protein YvlB [Cytobacillus kochii]MEA1855395.1 DUF4097 domain-containing protein [Cytobacillus sp. OWB-43]MED1607699.1 DUF4097 domain-containing protein [Cytobacillus kochii]